MFFYVLAYPQAYAICIASLQETRQAQFQAWYKYQCAYQLRIQLPLIAVCARSYTMEGRTWGSFPHNTNPITRCFQYSLTIANRHRRRRRRYTNNNLIEQKGKEKTLPKGKKRKLLVYYYSSLHSIMKNTFYHKG